VKYSIVGGEAKAEAEGGVYREAERQALTQMGSRDAANGLPNTMTMLIISYPNFDSRECREN
jgi:hypothetical protein